MGILAPLDSCNQLGPVKVQRECFRYGLAACIRRFKFLFSLVADGHVIRVNGFIAGLLRFVFLHVPLIRKEADLPFSLLPFFLNKMEPPNEQRKQHRKTKEKLDGFVCCVKEDWTGTPLVHLPVLSRNATQIVSYIRNKISSASRVKSSNRAATVAKH